MEVCAQEARELREPQMAALVGGQAGHEEPGDVQNQTLVSVTAVAANLPQLFNITQSDSNWMVTSAFIIFTMQTGFGLLESGSVSLKNDINIMVKTLVGNVLGGFTYWLFGFALSFGQSSLRNAFMGWGDFALHADDSDPKMGPMFTVFLFQLSFATTATTIVSGAMAERCSFKAYCIFCLLNTGVYCIPAGWVWSDAGFLNMLGVVDIAGAGPVHLLGGASGLASALMLGPRLGRYDFGITDMPLGTPVNAIMGLFVLWWGWLAFNAGSTLGVSGAKWHYSAKAAVMTLLSSFGGGIMGLFYTMYSHNGKVDLIDVIDAVLGSLVSVTGVLILFLLVIAGCFLYESFEAISIGFIGAGITCVSRHMLDYIRIDDPVGATSAHGMAGIWSVLAVGLFANSPPDLDTTKGRSGLLHGGGFYLLGVQLLSIVCISAWAFTATSLLLWLVNKIVPIRMATHQELLGADLTEHFVKHKGAGVSRAMAVLSQYINTDELAKVRPTGSNPGHEAFMAANFAAPPSTANLSRVGVTPRTVMHLAPPPPGHGPRGPTGLLGPTPAAPDEPVKAGLPPALGDLPSFSLPIPAQQTFWKPPGIEVVTPTSPKHAWVE